MQSTACRADTWTRDCRAHHKGTNRRARCPVIGQRASPDRSFNWLGDVGAAQVSRIAPTNNPKLRSSAVETADDLFARKTLDRDALQRRGSSGGDGDCIFLKA